MSKSKISKVKEFDSQNHLFTKEEICQVCFAKTKRESHQENNLFVNLDFDLIHCQKCLRSSHRGCYDSTIVGDSFICDLCQNNQTNPLDACCIFCSNSGLLKSIGIKKYAHPICVLFYGKIQKVSYLTLDFGISELPNNEYLQECQICNRTSSYLEQCNDCECKRKCHIFCSLKDASTDAQQTWSSLLQINNTNKSVKKNRRVSCPDHRNYCYCKTKIESNFMQCDQCLRWYHYCCIDMNNINIEDAYFCQYCTKWGSSKQKSFNCSQKSILPQLHFYDFIKVLRIYQKNPNPKIFEIIKLFPVKCSMNFYKSVRDYNLESYLEQTMYQMALSKAQNSLNNLKVNNSLAKHILSNYNSKFQSRQTDSNKEVINIHQIYDLLRDIPKKLQVKNSMLNKFMELYHNPQSLKLQLIYVVKYCLNKLKQSKNSINVFQWFINIVSNLQTQCKINDLDLSFSKNISILGFLIEPIKSFEEKNAYIFAFKTIKRLHALKLIKTDIAQFKAQIYQIHQQITQKHGLNIHLKQTLTQQIASCREYFYQRWTREIKKQDHLIKDILSNHQIMLKDYEHFKMIKKQSIRQLQGQYLLIKSIKFQFDQAAMINFPSYMKIGRVKKFLQQEKNKFRFKLSEQDLQIYRGYIYHYEKLNQILQLIGGYKLEVDEDDLYQNKIEYLHKSAINLTRKDTNFFLKLTQIIYDLRNCSINSTFKQSLKLMYSNLLKNFTLHSVEAFNLNKIVSTIQYLDVSYQQYDIIKQLLFKYKTWYRFYLSSIGNKKIQQYFENPHQLKLFKDKVRDGQQEQIEGINIERDIKILKRLQLWCAITEKLNKQIARKLTPDTTKQIFSIMVESQYPSHLPYYQRLHKMYKQCKQVQKSIDSLLMRNMFVSQEIDVFEQIKTVKSKAKITDLIVVQSIFKNSSINWEEQKRIIENEIHYFKQNQRQTERSIEKKEYQNLEELFRYFLLQSPFCYEGFEKLRNAYRSYQCKFIPNTKKDFDTIANWGGKQVQYLYEICKEKLAAHNRLRQIQISMINRSTDPFPSLEEIEYIFNNLFPNDPQRILIRTWVNEYCKLQKSVSKLNSKTVHQLYTITYLQNLLKSYDKIPIRSQVKNLVYQKIKNFHLINHSLKLPIYTNWFNGDKPLDYNTMLNVKALVSTLRQNRLTIPNQQHLISSVQLYQKLLIQQPSTHLQYVQFLKQSQNLGKRFQTTEFIDKRIATFNLNSDNYILCIKQGGTEQYKQQCAFLKQICDQITFTKVLLIQECFFSFPNITNDCEANKRQRGWNSLTVSDDDQNELVIIEEKLNSHSGSRIKQEDEFQFVDGE